MKFVSSVLALIFVLRLWRNSHKNPIDYLRECFGQDIVKIFRNWEDSYKKLKRCELDLDFLTTCKVYNVIPKFIRL